MQSYNEIGTCCICSHQYFHFGHNAWPIKDGRCCAVCNFAIVIPARMTMSDISGTTYTK